MAYDRVLAERVRRLLGPRAAVSERQMFGGICFMVNGKMVAGVTDGDLLVRVGKEGYAAAIASPHARPMKLGGTALKGFLFIGPKGTKTAAQLGGWVKRCLVYVATLPPPKAKKQKKPRR